MNSTLIFRTQLASPQTNNSTVDVVQQYFDAWNAHDASAIVALFAPEGSYSDPTTGQALRGQAIAGYASGLWAAFPDLSFEPAGTVAAPDGLLAAQWVMRGTNQGPILGMPPTGQTVALPGVDLIVLDGAKIRSVQGYFDTRTFVEQLGLQVVVQPQTAGPFVFGTSVMVQSGKRTRPGAFSMTMIDVRSDQEAEQVRSASRQIVTEMRDMRGFISWVGVVTGHRLMTITAWEDPEDPRQLFQNGTHSESVKQFFSPEFANGGMASVWVPERISLWVRCSVCGRMVSYDRTQGQCPCGERLPEPPPYW
jgi:steroid delta-isomerase-like uncharacterized protein